MKMKIISSLKLCILLSLFGTLAYSCTDEYITEENYYGPDWDVKTYTIYPEDWQWDGSRYYCVVNSPKLSELVYEEGAVLGSVFLGEMGVDEVQYLLPYIYTNRDPDTGIPYTRTISYDYNIGSICFYCQYSDLDTSTPYNMPPEGEFNFKMTLFWQNL